MDGISFDSSPLAVVNTAVAQKQQNAESDAQVAMLGKAMKSQSDTMAQLFQGMGIGRNVDELA